jgi:prolyl 4-hydroxylase
MMNQVSPRHPAQELFVAGRLVEALTLLNRDALANDAQALFTLAEWHLTGTLVRRDVALSREYFRRAAAAGMIDALRVFINFLANGTGGPADWASALQLLRGISTDPAARHQLDLIADMGLTPDGHPQSTPRGSVLSYEPEVVLFPRLFSPDECAFLIDAATPTFAPAMVVDPQTGNQMRNTVRTSDGMSFPLISESPAIHALNRRMALASGTSALQGEPLQVLRYSPGQEYRAHLDALPAVVNQRILTMLVYLNEDYEGGETLFFSTGLKVRGSVGDALLFRNATNDGNPDPMSRHAGLPVQRGTKYIASRWIRAEPLDLARQG